MAEINTTEMAYKYKLKKQRAPRSIERGVISLDAGPTATRTATAAVGGQGQRSGCRVQHGATVEKVVLETTDPVTD